MFRRATAEDVRLIYSLIRRLESKQGKIYGIDLDFESMVRTIEGVIQYGTCLVGKKSCAGAINVPFPFNNNAIVASVLFWYFETPREIRIFEALMHECKKDGATHISAASHFPHNRTLRYYKKLGLRAVETVVNGCL